VASGWYERWPFFLQGRTCGDSSQGGTWGQPPRLSGGAQLRLLGSGCDGPRFVLLSSNKASRALPGRTAEGGCPHMFFCKADWARRSA